MHLHPRLIDSIILQKLGGLICIIILFVHLSEIRGALLFQNASRSRRSFMEESRPYVGSKRWGVMTTIFKVNDAVRHFADTFQDAMCLVVVRASFPTMNSRQQTPMIINLSLPISFEAPMSRSSAL